jgi:hypothetical protein
VTTSDLVSGLYYFGCSREHIYEEKPDELTWATMDQELQRKILGMLREGLELAEEQGRARWELDRENSLLGVNELLVRNKFAAIKTNASYSYPVVERVVEDAGLEIEVVR